MSAWEASTVQPLPLAALGEYYFALQLMNILEKPMTLKSRLGAVRRRRRLTSLKRLLAVGPVFAGAAVLVFAAVGGIAGFR